MMLRGLLSGYLFGIVAFVGMGAEAATLKRKGLVLVNHGSGWHMAANTRTRLQTGDAVTAKPGGRGEIVYDDGCRDPVEPYKVVLVQDISPCVYGAGPWPIYALPGAGVVAGSLLISDFKDRAASP